MLIDFFHAELVSAQRRMLRPTAKMCPKLNDGFYFDVPLEADKAEIVQTVYEAHAAGYTSTVEKADERQIAEAIDRRFSLFTQTHTLDMGTVAKRVDDDAIVGVCIAGIYPESPNNFSTIHQVSVRPAFQRMGIAEAMMRNSIDKALEDAAKRELYEETGLIANHLEFFGVFSGKDWHYTYSNGDEVSIIEIVYICRDYSGHLRPQESEVEMLKFFDIDELPDKLSPPIIKTINAYVASRLDTPEQR